jgi:hypothetical protein
MDTGASTSVVEMIKSAEGRNGAVADVIRLFEMAQQRVAVVPEPYRQETSTASSTNAFAS